MVDEGVVGRVGDLVSAGALGYEAEYNGEGAEAGRGAGGVTGCPALSAVDGRKTLPVAGVGVGAGVEEVNGEDRVPFVGCDVERGALLSINVADRFRVRDECGA